jgi:hypothetical protein
MPRSAAVDRWHRKPAWKCASINRHDQPTLLRIAAGIMSALSAQSLIYRSPPRSNGFIGGSSFMIVQSLESVSGSRLLCPAVVMQ